MECQIQAGADRKGKGKQGKRPDIMFIKERKGKLYELIFVESFRLICLQQKNDDDEVKLWREMNDGLY